MTRITTVITRLAAALILSVGLAPLAGAEQQLLPQMEGATYIGEKACIECHGQEDSHVSDTLHVKMFRLNPKNATEKRVCEACHGPGSLHAKDKENKDLIIGFTRNWQTPQHLQNSMCLDCHKGGNRMHWEGSIHATNKLACSDCHNPMEKASVNSLLAKKSIVETCIQCHQQQRSEFMKRSHMPVLEGKMSCVDCHNPHGTVTKPLLKADSLNDVCYTCHAEKRGPFIWEHAPVRENCANCHQPHGSNQDKLLRVARPMLCSQCHFIGGANGNLSMAGPGATAAHLTGGLGGTAPNARMVGRSCQNCHPMIHGSNHPGGERFRR
ncbi:MAG: DmsE family decaheme c-type cytochrome [Azonexus sp.]|jgi:DmsE family decaheme c-type cytochrome|nr:DmsE family decaheme c-type cytochrome [Azonexus sp.]